MKKQNLLVSTSLTVLLALTACGSKSSNDPAAPLAQDPAKKTEPQNKAPLGETPQGDVALKADFKAQAMAAKQLSAADKEKVRQLTGMPSTIPSSELYFGTHKNDQEKQAALAKLDTNGKALLARVQSNCRIDKGQERKKGDGAIGTESVTELDQTINGAGCPIDYKSSTKNTTLITAMNPVTNQISGTVKSLSVISDALLDDTFKVGRVAVKSQTESKSDTEFKDLVSENGGVTKGLMRSNIVLNSNVTVSDGTKYDMGIKVEYVLAPNTKNIQMLYDVKGSDGLNLVAAIILEGTQAKIFVNGEEYTQDRATQELGLNFGNLNL